MSFIRGTEYANKLNSWHNNLEEDRQQRASLRRCSSLLDVYTSSGFRDLLFKLKPLWEGKAAWRFTALAIIAGVVSHVSENDPTLSFAERMAQKNGGAPVMSELRFRRLLAVRTEEGLFRELRRAVKLADGRLNIVSLADDVFRWCADNQMLAFNKGQDIRPTDLIQVRWSLDYYGASDDNNQK